jgi:hypothetical protein
MPKTDQNQQASSSTDTDRYENVQATAVNVALHGLKYQQVPGDGHCLFHAVALYCSKDQSGLRQEVATYLENHLGEFRDFIIPLLKPGQTLEMYIRDVRLGNEWADAVEIAILIKVLRRPIIIIRSDANPTIPNNISTYQGDPIFIHYNGSNHYDSFVVIGDANTKDILTRIRTQLAQGQTVTYQPVAQFDKHSHQYEQTYPQARAIEDAQWFAVTLTGNRQFLHTIGDESSLTKTFAKAIRDYKDDKDDTHNNRNKPISDLLWSALEKLAAILKTINVLPASYKFQTTQQAVSSAKAMHSSNPDIIASPTDNPEHAQAVGLSNTTVAPKVGMAFVYKLIAIIMAVLYAEKVLGPDKLNKSVFVRTMLLNLQAILLSRQPQKTKGKETSELILEILYNFENFALGFVYYADMRMVTPREKNRDHRQFMQALLKLVQYIIDKQTDRRHNVAKTEKAKQILLQLCEDETPENFKKLFKLICEGIQLSRSEGKNGEQSRDLEYALKELRDYLVRRLFSPARSSDDVSKIVFTQEQLKLILDSISYCKDDATAERLIRGPKNVVDADVCPHTLLVINKLKTTLDAKMIIKLQVEHCQRLITQIPEVVNRSAKIDVARYLFESGSSWPKLMTQLLREKNIDWKQRQQLQFYALIWNYRMVQCSSSDEMSSKLGIDYFVPISLLGEVIAYHRQSPDFPVDLKGLNSSKLDAMFCEMQQLYGKFDNFNYQSQGVTAPANISLNSSNPASPATSPRLNQARSEYSAAFFNPADNNNHFSDSSSPLGPRAGLEESSYGSLPASASTSNREEQSSDQVSSSDASSPHNKK